MGVWRIHWIRPGRRVHRRGASRLACGRRRRKVRRVSRIANDVTCIRCRQKIAQFNGEDRVWD